MSRVIRVVLLILSVIVLIFTCFSTVMAVHKGYPRFELAESIVEPVAELPQGLMAIPYAELEKPLGSPLGQTFLLGTTWYDYQSNGTLGKMVAVSPNQGIHFCWMNGLQVLATNRHVYYNYYEPLTGSLHWPSIGCQVDHDDRAGYTNLSQFSSGEVVVVFHQRITSGDNWNTAVAIDSLEGHGNFRITELDKLPGWGEIMWPKMTVCGQDYIHIVSTESRTDIWQRIAYARSQDGGQTFTSFSMIDTVFAISPDIAASPVSDKVGIAYCSSLFNAKDQGPYSGLSASLRNNDILLVESQDGTTWNFDDRRNITNLSWPDTSLYPDTTYANGDTLRAYCDVSLLYDQNDDAHVAFTTLGLWFDARPAAHPDSFAIVGMTLDASVIWHWSEEHDTLTVVAEGWYDVGDPDVRPNEYRGAGEWRGTVDRPSLGLDPTTGYLYCLYERCMPGDTSGGPIPSHGYANGELFCSVSTDGGLNWSEGTNLTNTPSPNAHPGSCMDEDYASLAAVVNDTLHIIYVEDKDAGGAVQTAPQEGWWTENPVRYLRVPANQVPLGPPYVSNYWFHVGPPVGPPSPPPTHCYCIGGTDWILYWDLLDYYGSPLEVGDYVCAAWAGPDGEIDPPAVSKGIGDVTGDDSLLVEGFIEDWGFWGFELRVDVWDPDRGHPTEGDLIYCRMFDAPKGQLSLDNYYGDSQLYQCLHVDNEEFCCLFPGDPGGGHTDTPLAPLSIELLSFGAVGRDGEVLLEWKTASEIDCFGFHIERSIDENSFQRVTDEIISAAGSSEKANAYIYVDRDVVNGTTYYYNLIELDKNGLVKVANKLSVSATPRSHVPLTHALHQNYPNPFNAGTEIRYQIPEPGHITLKICNTLGQEVRSLVDGEQGAGEYRVKWDGCDAGGHEAASGLYFCRLRVGEVGKTVKMVLMR